MRNDDFHNGFKGKSLVENYNRLVGAKNRRLNESGEMFGSGYTSDDEYMETDMVSETLLKGYEMIKAIEEILGTEETLDAVVRAMDEQVAVEIAEYIIQTHELEIDVDGDMNESTSDSEYSSMALSDIANVIRRDWKNVYFGAKPYLDAMRSLDSVDDDYGMDSGRSIVAYFLSNASTWRGEVAKAVKKELNKRIK